MLSNIKSFLNPNQPGFLIFYVTNRCNFRCNFCFYRDEIDKGLKPDELTLDEIKKFSKTIGPLIQLSLTGGEPYLRKEFIEIADVFFSIQPLRGKYTAILAAFNFKIPIWNKMLKSFKAIPVYRKNKSKAIEGIKQGEHIIKNLGYHIVIFPEGTRTINGELQSFKKGGFYMAINTKTPIIPVIVKGGFRFKPKNRWYIKPSIIDIKVGDPIDVKDYSTMDVDLLLNKTHSIFNELLTK